MSEQPSPNKPKEAKQKRTKPSARNAWTWVGYGLVFISSALLLGSFLLRNQQELDAIFLPDLGFFFIANYSMALLFFIIRFIDRKKGDTHNYALFLVLFSISAFSLNKDIGIFSDTTAWATGGLLLIHLPLLASNYRKELHPQLLPIFYFLSGFGFLLSLYFSIYILPIIPIGVVAFFLFGLPLHVMAPVLFTAEFARYLSEAFRLYSWKIGVWGLVGVVGPLGIAAGFAYKWNQQLIELEQIRAQASRQHSDHYLPQWVYLAQQLPENPLTDRMVQIDKVYDAPSGYEALLGKAGNSLKLGKYHDPLVVLSSAIVGKPKWEWDTQVNLMVQRLDLHHQARRRLWSDEDVQTASVKTSIDLFPEHRIAYTEKEITVRNATRNAWRQEQEALYTFYLPQGSAVTSLSLWVGGKEEQSILTTKSQADKAYKQIVGVERRDPALLHWQEGNRVSLRIFPCTPKENRHFKIGITSPLAYSSEGLYLPNAYFSGPELENTREYTTVRVIGKGDLIEQGHLNPVDGKTYQYQGRYRPYWELFIENVPLSEKPFVFEGSPYYTQPLRYGTRPLPIKELLLDINKEWSEEFFGQVCAIGERQGLTLKAFTPEDGWVLLDTANQSDIFQKLQKQQFSILPLGLVEHPEQSLVVVKSGYRSPTLSQVSTRPLQRFLEEGQSIATVNLGHSLSTYWQTLAEFGAIRYYATDLSGFEQLCEEKVFPNYGEEGIALPLSGMRLVKGAEGFEGKSIAPDHLMRLYAYNQVVKAIGVEYFLKEQYIQDPLVQLARQAHVVTPLSSLLVLETQGDYDQFNIEKSKDALENAQLANEGAVPEPGEWLLIALGVLVIGLLAYKKRLRAI